MYDFKTFFLRRRGNNIFNFCARVEIWCCWVLGLTIPFCVIHIHICGYDCCVLCTEEMTYVVRVQSGIRIAVACPYG